MRHHIALVTVLVGTALAAPALGQATADEVAALRAQLEALQAQLERLEAQQQQTAAGVATIAPAAPAAPAALATSVVIPGTRTSKTGISKDVGPPVPPPEPEAPSVVASRADRGVQVTLSGSVSQGILFAEQGDQDSVFVVDNDASPSRFGFTAETDFGDLSAGVAIEISAEVNSTEQIDFGSTDDEADENAELGEFRNANFFIRSDRLGFVSIGQGDTAAEDAAQVDLSGTAFAGSGSDVDDIAGGLGFEATGFENDALALAAVGLTDADVDGAFVAELTDFFDNQDDDRSLRILYETPTFFGVTLGVSLSNDDESLEGRDDEEIALDIDGDGLTDEIVFDDGDDGGLQVDVAANYEMEFGDGGEFALEVSYRQEERSAAVDVTALPGGGFSFDTTEFNDDIIVGSASVLLPSGINVTAAGSLGFLEEVDEDTFSVFGKLGYRRAFVPIGESRLSVDYFFGETNPAFAALDLEGEIADLPQAQSVGVFAVQDLRDLNTELYVGYRFYDVDDVFMVREAGQAELELDGLNAVIAGGRVRF